TRLLKKLEEDKLIVGRPDPEDRRSKRIFLTPLGAEKKAIAHQQVEQFNSAVRANIPQEDLRTFFDVLEKIHLVIKENTNGKAS
ncbi:MAG: MarR family transcriptional regulator, partial [Bacteroidia bacterium]